MRHIALIYCDEDLYPVPEVFEELELRHRLHFPDYTCSCVKAEHCHILLREQDGTLINL